MSPSKRKGVDDQYPEMPTSLGRRDVASNKKDTKAKNLAQEDIHIDPNYELLVPRPTTEEYEALKESIARERQRDPIIINKEGVVLDGHTRFKILKELNTQIQFELRSFSDKQAEKDFVIEAATIRRNLSVIQKVRLLQPILEIEQEKARNRQKSGIRTSVSNDTQVGSGRATEIVAKRFGIPITTFERARYIIEHAHSELISAIEEGEESINGAYKILREVMKKGERDANAFRSNSPEENIVNTELRPPSLGKIEDEASGKLEEGQIDRQVKCESCKRETKRGEAKRVLLCKECRQKLQMDW